jgi:hypothetical protein
VKTHSRIPTLDVVLTALIAVAIGQDNAETLAGQQVHPTGDSEIVVAENRMSSDLWPPNAPVETFRQKVLEWLDRRRRGPRLIADASDQVPLGADEV